MLDLKTRLFEWISIPRAVYELGAHLGFWEEFGDRAFKDPWHHHKEEIFNPNSKSEILYQLLQTMINNGLIEKNEHKKVKWKNQK